MLSTILIVVFMNTITIVGHETSASLFCNTIAIAPNTGKIFNYKVMLTSIRLGYEIYFRVIVGTKMNYPRDPLGAPDHPRGA